MESERDQLGEFQLHGLVGWRGSDCGHEAYGSGVVEEDLRQYFSIREQHPLVCSEPQGTF
jgi:hypothetical protein